jgi:hypothetical protein
MAREGEVTLVVPAVDTGADGSTTGTDGSTTGGSTANPRPDKGFLGTDGSTTGTDGSTTAIELRDAPPEAPDPEPEGDTAEIAVCHHGQEALIRIPIRGACDNTLWPDLAQPLDLPFPPSRRRG